MERAIRAELWGGFMRALGELIVVFGPLDLGRHEVLWTSEFWRVVALSGFVGLLLAALGLRVETIGRNAIKNLESIETNDLIGLLIVGGGAVMEAPLRDRTRVVRDIARLVKRRASRR
jgi:hypothetical protein